MFKKIETKDLMINPFEKIGKEWALVAAGKENDYNMMTISWGELGHLWNEDVATIFVRPQRYTKKFVDQNNCFSICFFDKRFPLEICGKISGRDHDKAKEAGITPIFTDNTVAFNEASLVIVCEKIYTDIIKEDSFLDETLRGKTYPKKDYHTMYIGRIKNIYINE